MAPSLTINTALIVLAQLFVLRLVRRARGSSALAVSGLILAASWAVLLLAVLPTAPIGRAAFVFGFTALFGLGETVLAPTAGPLVNRLTDNTIGGQANSLAALSQSLAFIVCPHWQPASSPPVQPQSGLACCAPVASAPSPSGPGFAAR